MALAETEPGEVDLVASAASFWRRFAAAFVDGVLLTVVNLILRLIGLSASAEEGVSLAVALAYFTYFHGSTGQTPGDAALGIRVVDLREGTGRPIGFGRAALRWLVSIVSTIVILVGYLWMLWDPQRQTWHDKAAGSLPIKL